MNIRILTAALAASAWLAGCGGGGSSGGGFASSGAPLGKADRITMRGNTLYVPD